MAKSELPLSPLTMAILLALAEGEQHGYALMREIGRQTGTAPGTGSLYAALDRLSAAGLIAETARRPDAAEDARRKYFRITRAGRATARAEAIRMLEVVRTARDRSLIPDVT